MPKVESKNTELARIFVYYGVYKPENLSLTRKKKAVAGRVALKIYTGSLSETRYFSGHKIKSRQDRFWSDRQDGSSKQETEP